MKKRIIYVPFILISTFLFGCEDNEIQTPTNSSYSIKNLEETEGTKKIKEDKKEETPINSEDVIKSTINDFSFKEKLKLNKGNIDIRVGFMYDSLTKKEYIYVENIYSMASTSPKRYIDFIERDLNNKGTSDEKDSKKINSVSTQLITGKGVKDNSYHIEIIEDVYTGIDYMILILDTYDQNSVKITKR